MDIQAMQSMDWLFKKERIYLLAQFWQQRATLAEKEVAALKEQLAGSPQDSKAATAASAASTGGMPAAARGSSGAGGESESAQATPGQGESGTRPGLEQELAAKDKEISQLSEDIARLQAALARAQEGTAAQVARLEEQLEQRSVRIARLEARLDAQRDYEDVKRELSILRAMDLPTFAAAAAAAAAAAQQQQQQGEGAPQSVAPPAKTLELLNEAASALSSVRRSTSPMSEERNQQGGTPTPTSSMQTPSGGVLFPPALQTVETFGSFLGEEIVANWRRSLERTILSQNASSSSSLPTSSQQQQSLSHEEHSLHGGSEHPSAPSSPDAGDIKPNIQRSVTPPPAPSTPSMLHLHQQQMVLMNGTTPKTPPSESPGSGLNSPNNGLLSSTLPPTSTSTPIPSDGPKTSPFRFDERGPFRFDDRVSLGESLIPKGDPMEARLQEMLRYNMDQYASQNLDTLHIARRVRELLSIHNIGQRLFAKYVLGLSQGTVSELLSKPKPWDKLTEKGRDSYRKMHAWACDENAVMLLKSLIPKKGKEGGAGGASLPPFGPGRPGEDNLTEERIALILNEASQAMKSGPGSGGPGGPPNPNVLAAAVAAAAAAAQQQQDDSRSNDSRSPASAQEKVVARIYQEELAKLMGRRIEDSLRVAQQQQQQQGAPPGGPPPQPGQHFPSLLFPHFFGPGGGGGPGQMDRTHDEIRLALDAYHRELAKLNHSALQGGALPPGLLGLPPHHPGMPPHNGVSPQDLSLPKPERPASAAKHSPHHSSSSSSHNGPLSDVDDKAAVAKEISDAAAVADALRHAGSAFSLVRPKTEPGTPGSQSGSTTTSSAPTAAAGSAVTVAPSTTVSSSTPAPSPLNNILPPAGPEDFTATAASPLQRMASITNSLISSPAAPSHHSPAQRPLKAVLPPITQQQFDQFNNLNTEDIVKKVKEQLSQYSISQRLFGESVLGLSQGSVSDLLARPKPWHMLTQKGREPFIRMKMFLEDENAVHKLVASQYKIAPEKLMRTGGYGSINPRECYSIPLLIASTLDSPGFEPMNFGIPRERDVNNFHPKAGMKSSSKPPKLPDPVAKAMENAHAAAAAALGNPSGLLPGLPPPPPQQPPVSQPSTPGPQLPPPHSAPPTPSPGLLRHPGSPPHDSPSPAGLQLKKQQSPASAGGGIPRAMAAALQHQQQPSVYEMAALTQDLDTQLITTRIKEALLANNIGQKIFGEVVLGLSQGSVSELLSKPKPWHMLSIKGREPFIRMQLWLTDPNNVERLQQMKSERREANKRRRTTTGTNGPADNSSDTSSNDTAEFYHAPTGSPGPPSAKKQRVLFSEEQKEALRLAFALDPYPNMATIEFLANELNLAARTITNWFHNHRMRLKQTLPHGNNNNETQQPPPNQSSQQNSSSTFDPSHFRLLLSQRLTEIHKERGGGAMPPFPFFNPSVAAMVSPSSGGPMPPLPPLPPLPPQHLLMAAAMREQLSGLDLSMTSLKKEESDGEDDDNSADSDDSNLSADFSSHHRMPPVPAAAPVRSASRRKPAAPQWVNPEWQADEKEKDDAKDSPPAIINGVCVMQTDNFESCLMRRTTEVDDDDTVRIEPTAAPEALVAARAEKESSDVEDEDGVGADDEAPSTTTLELGVSASAASAPETSVSAVDDVAEDWEQKIDDADEPDKRMKVQDGGEDWEF